MAAERSAFWTFNADHAAIIGVMISAATPIGFFAKWAFEAADSFEHRMTADEVRIGALERQADGSHGDLTTWQRDMRDKVDRIANDVAVIKGHLNLQRGEASPPLPLHDPRG